MINQKPQSTMNTNRFQVQHIYAVDKNHFHTEKTCLVWIFFLKMTMKKDIAF